MYLRTMRAVRASLLLGIAAPGLLLAMLLHLSNICHAVLNGVAATPLPFSSAAARLVAAASRAAGPSSLLMYQGYVAQATVLVSNQSCAGFLAAEPDLVVTAAHCVPEGVRRVTVLTTRNERLVARLQRIDRNNDLAVLRLPKPLDVPPLPLASQLPERREPLLFAGRADRPGTAQVGAVQKIGRCPSLPRVSRAIFTSIDARPGDSGAPVLDSQLQVVGVIHGGARCHILAPVAPLARQLEIEDPDPRTQA
jgi:S1-C subfamily serine protease